MAPLEGVAIVRPSPRLAVELAQGHLAATVAAGLDYQQAAVAMRWQRHDLARFEAPWPGVGIGHDRGVNGNEVLPWGLCARPKIRIAHAPQDAAVAPLVRLRVEHPIPAAHGNMGLLPGPLAPACQAAR